MAARLLALICAVVLGCRTAASGPEPASPREIEAEARLENARVLLERGNPSDAVDLLEQALVLWPEEAADRRSETRRLLVHVCAQVQDPERGLAHIDAELAHAPGEAWLWYARGAALTTIGRYGQACSAFGSAIALEPTHAKALQWRAYAGMLLGRHEESLRDLDVALELLRTVELVGIPEGSAEMRRRVLLQRADALDALGRHDEARADRAAARAAAGAQP